MSWRLMCAVGALSFCHWLSSTEIAVADVMEPSLTMPAVAPFAPAGEVEGAGEPADPLGQVALGLVLACGVAAVGGRPGISGFARLMGQKPDLGRPPGHLTGWHPQGSGVLRKKLRKPPVLEDC
jgi:hypothetical protein